MWKYVSMSLTARVSFSSAAILPSACLRCCRTPCAFSWSCQKAGSLAFASRDFRRSRLVATSKIAPHELDALFQFVKARLKIFNEITHNSLPVPFRLESEAADFVRLNPTITSSIVASTLSHASQSPVRVYSDISERKPYG